MPSELDNRAAPKESRGGPINDPDADALDFLPSAPTSPRFPHAVRVRVFTFHFVNYALSVGTSLAVNE